MLFSSRARLGDDFTCFHFSRKLGLAISLSVQNVHMVMFPLTGKPFHRIYTVDMPFLSRACLGDNFRRAFIFLGRWVLLYHLLNDQQYMVMFSLTGKFHFIQGIPGGVNIKVSFRIIDVFNFVVFSQSTQCILVNPMNVSKRKAQNAWRV